MQSHDYFKFYETCPVHGSPIRHEYEFGKWQDATVTTFKGCRCAVGTDRERCWYKGSAYFESYSEASGYARLVTMGNATR